MGNQRDTSEWTETDSKDNVLATAAHALEASKRHFITSISVAYSAAAIGLVQIKDDTTVIWDMYVHNQLHMTFPKPLQGTIGQAVSVELAASGAGGVLGKANISGYTE